MFPDAENCPSMGNQVLVDLCVSVDVRRQLRLPPFPVLLRQRAVSRTLMPETPVDENGNPETRERHIRSGSRPRNRVVDPVSISACMKHATDSQLWLGISLSLTLHPLTRLLRGCNNSPASHHYCSDSASAQSNPAENVARATNSSTTSPRERVSDTLGRPRRGGLRSTLMNLATPRA